MSSRRVLKVAEAIREVVSMAILTQLRDPRVRDVTVTFVEVSADLRHAKIHVSVMGDENKEQLCLHGLESATGFLQRKVGDRLDTRYIPRLKFVLDKGVKHSLAVARILEEVLPEEEAAATAGSEAEGGVPDGVSAADGVVGELSTDEPSTDESRTDESNL